jgi:hypothetical protein
MDALHRATIDRMRRGSVVLVAQDSSSLRYTMNKALQHAQPRPAQPRIR